MRRYLTRVFRLTGRATGVQQANQRTVTSAPVNITVNSPSNGVDPQVEPLMGWGADTQGAWSGVNGDDEPALLIVETLSGGISGEYNPGTKIGKGSLKWALAENYPRVIVFEVGGVIDFGWELFTVTNPYLTVAGHTAPNPGITIIRGGISIRSEGHTIVQHIAIRPGRQHSSSSNYAFNIGRHLGADPTPKFVLVDSCSFTWATRRTFIHVASGTHPEEDRVPGDITISNCILAEGLRGFAQSQVIMLQMNQSNTAILRNLMSYHNQRFPLMSGARGAYINNYTVGWKDYCTYHSTNQEDHDAGSHAIWTYIGNHSRASNDSNVGARHMFYLSRGNASMYFEDNQLYAVDGVTEVNPVYRLSGSNTPEPNLTLLDSPPYWHHTFDGRILARTEVINYLEDNVGSRPWTRKLPAEHEYNDGIDKRIIEEAINETGKIFDRDGVPEDPDDWEWKEEFFPTTPNPVPMRLFNMNEWEWWDGGSGDGKNRVLLNKATGTYAHPEDL